MAALPYMQLYVADYLADTMHLSTEEHGAYLLLIFNYWQTGKPIPKNRLARIARLSNDRWAHVEQTLAEFFTDDGESWSHDRIDRELLIVKRKQEQRSKAGKVSGKTRAKTATSNKRSTTDQQALNEKATKPITDTDTEAVGSSSTHPEISQGAQPREPVCVDDKPHLQAAIALRKRGLRITPQNPDLLAAIDEGVTPEALDAMAQAYPDKPAGYVIAAARRQRAESARPTPTGGNHGDSSPRGRQSSGPDDPNEPGISLAERSRRTILQRRQREQADDAIRTLPPA